MIVVCSGSERLIRKKSTWSLAEEWYLLCVLCFLVWWGCFTEGVFAALGPVNIKSGTGAGIAFFPVYHTWMICIHAAWKWWIVSGLSFPSWKAGSSAAAPFLQEDLTQSSGQKLGWQCIAVIRLMTELGGPLSKWEPMCLGLSGIKWKNKHANKICVFCVLAHLKGLQCAWLYGTFVYGHVCKSH